MSSYSPSDRSPIIRRPSWKWGSSRCPSTTVGVPAASRIAVEGTEPAAVMAPRVRRSRTDGMKARCPETGEFMRAIVPCGVAAHPGIVRAGRGRSGGLGDWTYAPGPAVRGLDPGRKPMSEQFDQQRIDAALAGVDDW